MEEGPYDFKRAVARVQELFSVSERVADAILTIAASEIGEYTLNGWAVIGSDDAQGWSFKRL